MEATRRIRRSGRWRPVLVAGTAAVLLLAACGDGGDAGADPTAADTMTDMTEGEHTEGSTHEFPFGEPADAADADRTIQVDAQQGFVFAPVDVTIEVGEVITFEVVNTDEIQHDFFLGDEAAQQVHEEEMQEMAEGDGEMAHDDPNALTVAAGETATLTWHFTEPGTIQYGCHEPGHYAAGMFGEITIE